MAQEFPAFRTPSSSAVRYEEILLSKSIARFPSLCSFKGTWTVYLVPWMGKANGIRKMAHEGRKVRDEGEPCSRLRLEVHPPTRPGRKFVGGLGFRENG